MPLVTDRVLNDMRALRRQQVPSEGALEGDVDPVLQHFVHVPREPTRNPDGSVNTYIPLMLSTYDAEAQTEGDAAARRAEAQATCALGR